MPLTVTATIIAKPGSEAAVGEVLRALVPPSRQDEGCLSYDLYQSAADSSVFITIEQWETREDLQAHMQTSHVQEALSGAADLLNAAPQIHPLTPLEV